MTTHHPAREVADAVADHFAHPDIAGLPTDRPWWRQSLAHGVPGIALLHIERASAGLGPWQRAHDWLTCATRTPITAGGDSFLYYGAPAIAHALDCAATHRPGAYARALTTLDAQIATDTLRRVDAAHARMDSGQLPTLAEFDVIRGIAGVGGYLLRRDPEGKTTRAVLEYMVRLTMGVTVDGETLPGWWADSSPSGRASGRFTGGHANIGLSHGIAGPLALLALAARRGTTVNGHAEAIGRICAWLDQWRRDTPASPVWPCWVTRPQLRAGPIDEGDPLRPSWCYGTAGLARAQQLAALATGDTNRRHMAEDALVRALADPVQRAATTDSSLCHGYAGLAHIATYTAADAAPAAATRLNALIPELLDAVQPPGTDPRRTAATLLDPAGIGPGLLEGAAGIALAVHAPSTGAPPQSGWDACLLIA